MNFNYDKDNKTLSTEDISLIQGEAYAAEFVFPLTIDENDAYNRYIEFLLPRNRKYIAELKKTSSGYTYVLPPVITVAAGRISIQLTMKGKMTDTVLKTIPVTGKITVCKSLNADSAAELDLAEEAKSSIIDILDKKASLLDVYPIGALYLSVVNKNPSSFFGGTWAQITSNAYLKIVTSNGGGLGGTAADHRIPIGSMPGHTHKLFIAGSTGMQDYVSGIDYGPVTSLNESMSPAGLGQPYLPYYLGVFVWKRTA